MAETKTHLLPVLPDHITVRLEKPSEPQSKGLLSQLKEIGPLITGIGTLLLSIVSFYYVHTLDVAKEQEAALKMRQDAITKAVQPTTKVDDPQRDVAAMTLASYGQASLPTIRVLLSGSQPNPQMRQFGIQVVKRWMDAGDPAARSEMIMALSANATSSSLSLRQGSYAAILEIFNDLGAEEKQAILRLLNERFGSGDSPLEKNSETAKTAAILLGNFPYADGRTALRNIARDFDPQVSLQALDSYSYLLNHDTSPGLCALMLQDLNELKLPGTPNSASQQLFGSVKDQAGKRCGK